MKRSAKRCLTLLLSIYFFTLSNAAGAELIGADEWTSFGTTAIGQLNGINFTLTGLDDHGSPSQAISRVVSFNVSEDDFIAAPLTGVNEGLEFISSSDWVLNIEQPVDGLYLYIASWREGHYDFGQTYKFSGFGTGLTTLIQYDSSELDTKSRPFSSGILFFDGPIQTLSIEAVDAPNSFHLMTFAVVPEPSSLALFGLGSLLAIHRRLH